MTQARWITQDRRASVLALVVLAAAAVDTLVALVVASMLYNAFGTAEDENETTDRGE